MLSLTSQKWGRIGSEGVQDITTPMGPLVYEYFMLYGPWCIEYFKLNEQYRQEGHSDLSTPFSQHRS